MASVAHLSFDAASLAGLDAGDWIIRVSGGGTKGSDSFGGFYDIPVKVGD